MLEAEIKVYGRVQGVNFRNNVKRFSDEIELKGNVRNLGDGSVLIIAQGSNEQIDKLIDFIKLNPGFSKVEKVEKKIGVVKTEMSNFEVVHEGSLFNDKRKALGNLGKLILAGQSFKK